MRKNKLGYLKKGLIVLLSTSIIQISFDSTLLKIYAEEVSYTYALEAYCEEHPLEGYLYIQEQEDTGIMDAKLEAELNAQGIFDSEIMDFSEDEIKELENADDIYISTEYIKYTYTGEDLEECFLNNQKTQEEQESNWKNKNFELSDDQNIIEEILNIDSLNDNVPEGYEVERMSDEDVDELIRELYFDEESENEETFFDKWENNN